MNVQVGNSCAQKSNEYLLEDGGQLPRPKCLVSPFKLQQEQNSMFTFHN